MKNRVVDASLLRDRARELRSELAHKICRVHGLGRGSGNGNSRRDAPPADRPTAPCSATYEPGVTVIAQGRKRVGPWTNHFIYGDRDTC